jgi:hypothetical protein
MGLPVLIGAGLGAITNKNPLKGALLGGALGGIGGGASSLLKGGSFLEGAGLSGLSGATAGTGTNLAANGAGVTLDAVKNGVGQGIQLSSTPVTSSLTDFGINPLVAGSTDVASNGINFALNPTSSMGGLGSIDNLASYANMSPDQLSYLAKTNPTMFDKLSKYATIDNLSGAANIASKFQPRQPSPAPQGRVTEGKAPSGGIGQGGVEGLLAELEKQRQQTQRQPISLLVG